MAAPDHVPTDPTKRVRAYTSPPRRADAWMADRPGDLTGGQPKGAALGTAGPDQGYAYRLVHLFDDRLHLGGVDREDAVAGCVALAMKRSGLFGRAPVVHDLTAAFTIYGFLDQNPAGRVGRGRAGQTLRRGEEQPSLLRTPGAGRSGVRRRALMKSHDADRDSQYNAGLAFSSSTSTSTPRAGPCCFGWAKLQR